MTRTIVHLLRHGEVFNPRHVLYGRLPGFHLSEAGLLMAKRAAEALTGHDVVLVLSSPLERARETAEPVAARFGVPVEIDERLIEATNAFEGQRVGDGALRRPRSWWLVRNPWRPSWGEPYVEVAARMWAAVQDARRRAAGHEAVCVSHQLPIWTVRRMLERRPLWHHPGRRQCALGSITSLVFDDEAVVAVTYAEPSGRAGIGELAGA
ncbi:Phosphoglycerate mutase [Acidothermus cellulolyticus 11B]|uniref:Phosphoglycerate mutase n=1 Tax=Acidothermus cellulolyticus (strain ATCC 43068 / DSM 8971 / 11B) TaxID=351607 RepID=A0LRG4_ACIC1|nr:histidine phosphatase family protein [Acidothermus cellulolyticus]ABK52024.1 Phosphoglycerate mutase [Acidothermus cellulolyticus 11B]